MLDVSPNALNKAVRAKKRSVSRVLPANGKNAVQGQNEATTSGIITIGNHSSGSNGSSTNNTNIIVTNRNTAINGNPPSMVVHQLKRKTATSLEYKKVAAYARVSSDKYQAEESLDTQISYYEKYILNHAGYELAGIYADEGISGTNPNRPMFQKMIEDAKAGEIDLIITKSVSRFARNIVTLLTTLRELAELKIDVYFESENIHSISATGEMLITMLAMYAEEQARSASENKLWQIRKQFERGIPTYNRMLGLKWVNGQFQIVPEEAKVVRRIFELYLSGKGKFAIAKQLEKEGVKPLLSKKWSLASIYDILHNEKYAGDLLLQKTYYPDFRTKKGYHNTGQRTRFYIEDAHDAIIPREMFNQVQNEIKRRQKLIPMQNDYKKTLFKGILKCGHCGQNYTRKHQPYNNAFYFWICGKYANYSKKGCSAKQIRESILIAKTRQVLELPDKTELTHELIIAKIERIDVLPDNALCFHLKNGEIKNVFWETPSRSKSWTPEMKERARQKNTGNKSPKISSTDNRQ